MSDDERKALELQSNAERIAASHYSIIVHRLVGISAPLPALLDVFLGGPTSPPDLWREIRRKLGVARRAFDTVRELEERGALLASERGAVHFAAAVRELLDVVELRAAAKAWTKLLRTRGL